MSTAETSTLVRNLHTEIKSVIEKILAENNCCGVGAPTPQQVDKNLEIVKKLEEQMVQLQLLNQLN